VPIRSGALSRRLAALQQALRQSSMLQRRRVRTRLGFATGAVVVTTVMLGIGLAVAQPAPRPPGFPAKPANIAITTTTGGPRASTPTSAAPAAPAPAHSAPTTTLTPIPNAQVTAIGDSVMLGAQSSLHRFLGDRLQMDANVSRHFSEGLDVVRRLHDAGQLGDEVVVHLGTNGSVPADQLDEMMQLLSGVKRVVLVNTRVDRPWEQPDNDAIAAEYFGRFPIEIADLSGDFYWLAEKEGRLYIAVADCTGHGVPGALVSVIGINMLNKIIEQPGKPSPSEILEFLHVLVIHALNKDADARDTNDGMDISLLCIDTTSKKALFSGAGRPLYYVDDSGFHFIKGDRFSIAGEKQEDDAPYTEFEIPLSTKTTFYLSSDGYVDQFGQATGKKYLSKKFNHLLETVSSLPMNEQAEKIDREFANWKGSLEQVDDVMVLGIRV